MAVDNDDLPRPTPVAVANFDLDLIILTLTKDVKFLCLLMAVFPAFSLSIHSNISFDLLAHVHDVFLEDYSTPIVH